MFEVRTHSLTHCVTLLPQSTTTTATATTTVLLPILLLLLILLVLLLFLWLLLAADGPAVFAPATTAIITANY